MSWEQMSARFKDTADAFRSGRLGSALDTDQLRNDVDALADEIRERPQFSQGKARLKDIQRRLDSGEVWPGDLDDAAAIASALGLDDAVAPATHAQVEPRKRL